MNETYNNRRVRLLTQATPASRAFETRMALLRFSVNTAEAKPKEVSFAISMASAYDKISTRMSDPALLTFFSLEFDNSCDRSKDLLTNDCHVRSHVSENGGLDEVSF